MCTMNIESSALHSIYIVRQILVLLNQVLSNPCLTFEAPVPTLCPIATVDPHPPAFYSLTQCLKPLLPSSAH